MQELAYESALSVHIHVVASFRATKQYSIVDSTKVDVIVSLSRPVIETFLKLCNTSIIII